jgi:hypothetical protein
MIADQYMSAFSAQQLFAVDLRKVPHCGFLRFLRQ